MRRNDWGRRDNRSGGFRRRDDGGGYRGNRRRDFNYGSRKRRREDEPRPREMTPSERLRRLLIRVGEKSKASLSKNLDGLAKAVQVDIEQYETLILKTLFDCVIHLGVKIPIHATLVGLITLHEPDFGGKVLSRLKNGLEDSVRDGDIFKFRHYVRFLGCLHNSHVIVGADYARILKSILENLKKDSLSQRTRDHLAHVVLSSLVHSGKMLSENYTEEYRDIFEALKTYMESRDSATYPNLQTLTTQNVRFLEDYWKAFQKVESEGWGVESILHPEQDFEKLSNCKEQDFILELPEWDEQPSLRSVNHFGVMKLVEVEDKIEAMEISIASEYLNDILHVFDGSPAYAAEHIINLPLTFDHKFIAMECLFTNMLAIPKPDYGYAYYGRVIIELFDKQPKVWPKAVGRCLLHLFEKLESLDVEARDNLAKWFAFHLNNFGNNWPWHKWNFVVTLPDHSPKKVFCVQVLRQQMALANWEKVMNSLQDPFNTLMPVTPASTLKYNLKPLEEAASDDTKSANDMVVEVVRMLNRKLSVDDIQNYLDTWFDPNVHGKYGLVDIFWTCLLHVGQSSISHFVSYFKTYQNILRESLSDDESKVTLLIALYDFWHNSQDRIINILEKLYQYKLVNSKAIAMFIFRGDNMTKHADPFWMQLLCQSLNRVFLTYDGLSSKQIAAQHKLKALIHEEDIEEMKTKLQKIEEALAKISPMLGQILRVVFSGFQKTLCHLMTAEEDIKTSYLFRVECGNMVWIIRKYRSNILPFKDELEKEFFSGDCPEEVQEVWTGFWNSKYH